MSNPSSALPGPAPREPQEMKYGCYQCQRDYTHQPLTFSVPGIPARTFFFCSTACREAWHRGQVKGAIADSALQQAQATIQQLAQELTDAREWSQLVTRGKSPCGHWSAHALTTDGGHSITCLDCDLAETQVQLLASSALILPLQALVEQIIGRLEYGHLVSVGSIDNTRVIQIGVDELTRWRDQLAALLPHRAEE